MHAQKPQKKAILVAAAAVLLMAGVIGWLLSSKPTDAPVQEVKEGTMQQVNNSTIQEVKNGKKVWELTVESMLYDRKKQIDHMKGIKGTFYQDDGRTMTVTADEGEVHVDTKSVVLTKNPKGITSDDGEVTADKITWLNDKQLVLAEGNAHIRKGDVKATAYKATFNVTMDHATLEKDAYVQKGEF